MVERSTVAERPAIGGVSGTAAKSKPGKKSIFRKKKFLIGGGVVVLAIGYLIFAAIQSSSMYYLTVSELKQRADTLGTEPVRLGGKVIDGTIDWNSSRSTLSFKITDDKETVSITYTGVVPDSFKAGADVIVEGTYDPNVGFQATNLLAKCPSKYIPGT